MVGFPHDIKGEGIYCYVTLKDLLRRPVGGAASQLGGRSGFRTDGAGDGTLMPPDANASRGRCLRE